MPEHLSETRRILVTGGTSGLGAELVKVFLAKGWSVTATGRNPVSYPQYTDRFRFVRIDFADLADVARKAGQMTDNGKGFDLIVNNAGVLGFPGRVITNDGLAYTFQVNFLAHLLLDEIIIRNKTDLRPLKIISVISPVYRWCSLKKIRFPSFESKGTFGSYAWSKFYLAILGSHLSARYPLTSLNTVAFNPGTFGSAIYRTKGPFFRFLYRIAAPFMKDPAGIAARFEKIFEVNDQTDGFIYSRSGRRTMAPVAVNDSIEAFWKACHDKTDKYMK